METISFTSRGVRCEAWHLAAVDDRLTSAAGRPCVVMAHGFGATRDAGLLPFAERFAAAGLDALVFDYRGYGTSAGRPRQHVSHLRHRQDFHAALAAARALPGVDPTRIALWGSSYSGGHVLPVAVRDGRVAAVVSQGAAVDGIAALRRILAHAGPRHLLRLTAHGLYDAARALVGAAPHHIPVVGPPGTLAAITAPGAEAGYRSITGPTFRNQMCARGVLSIALNRPVRAAGALPAPTLFVVAEDDDLAPPDAVRAAVRAAGVLAEVLTLPCGHFAIYSGLEFERSVAAQVDFLSRRLRPDRRPSRPVRTAPRRLPVLGHVVPLGVKPLEFLTGLRAHGDIVKLYLGGSPAYLLNDPDLIHRVFVTDAARYHKGRLFDVLRAIMGNGLTGSEDPFHRRQRALVRPAFTRDRVRGYVDAMSATAVELTGGWRPGQALDVDGFTHDYTLGVLMRTLLPTQPGAVGRELGEALPVMMREVLRQVALPSAVADWPTPGRRRYERARAVIHRVADEVIAAYRADGADRGDVISMLVSARDEDAPEGMTDPQVRDEIVTMLIAAVDNAGVTLSWFFHHLGRHPEVERRVHEEVDRVVGDRPVAHDDLVALRYTGRALAETLRLSNPTPILSRRPTSDVVLDGLPVPAGTELMISIAALHRDPVLYPDPMRFDPDRWADDRHHDPANRAYLPFGAGPRGCVGQDFAWLGMLTAIATTVARWRLVPDPEHRVKVKQSVIPRPDRLPMTVHPRP
ncbi:cytochrome P450 [Actinosynnema sp. NPDC020468]|uniref:cytochrome P450 n=1 Tax=Actinosynnema sp. NPDC020468 TaxID=3154488 RepID=UPI0033F32449